MPSKSLKIVESPAREMEPDRSKTSCTTTSSEESQSSPESCLKTIDFRNGILVRPQDASIEEDTPQCRSVLHSGLASDAQVKDLASIALHASPQYRRTPASTLQRASNKRIPTSLRSRRDLSESSGPTVSSPSDENTASSRRLGSSRRALQNPLLNAAARVPLSSPHLTSCEDDNGSQPDDAILDLSNYQQRKLYDREQQMNDLQDALQRRRKSHQKKELVLVTGCSGAGKTELAKSLRQDILDQGGYFVMGKFDLILYSSRHSREPYSAIVTAFNEFATQVIKKGEPTQSQVNKRILQAVGAARIHVLTESIPSLGKLLVGEIHVSTHCSSSKNESTQALFTSLFRKLMLAICSPSTPLVLLLDDLQWADPSSLELVSSLIAHDIPGFLLMGTCRQNEVSFHDGLAVTLRQMEDSGVAVTEIRVGNLELGGLVELLRGMLRLSASSSLALAKLLHKQTEGNVFFVLQVLQGLVESEILTYHRGSWRWQGSEGILGMEHMAESEPGYNVLELLASRMKRTSPEAQNILQMAACLGNEFDEELLMPLVQLSSSQLETELAILEDRSLVVLDDRGTSGQFAHDKFLEAAYSLIPEKEKAKQHLDNARCLLDHLNEDQVDRHLFAICNQFSLGLSDLKPTEKEQVAMLCGRAARKSAGASVFASAVLYVDFAIELLEVRHWRDQYQLSLELYNLAAELEYCIGNHLTVDKLVGNILQNARTFEDKLQAYGTHIYSLGSRGDGERAIDEGFSVLKELGEAFPRRLVLLHTIRSLIATQKLLKNKTDEDILNLPLVTDTKVLSAMKILKVIYPHILISRSEYAPLVAMRSISITFEHGLSPMSSVGFGTYSLTLLYANIGNVNECYRYGQVALRLLDKFPGNEFLARTYGSVYGLVFPAKDPLRNSLQPLLKGHRTGLMTGDIEISLMCCSLYGGVCIFSSAPLENSVKQMQGFQELCFDYHQPYANSSLAPLLQIGLNFQGRAKDDPLCLTGDAMNEAQLLQISKETKNDGIAAWIFIGKYMLAVYLNDAKAAKAIAKQFQKANMVATAPFILKVHRFHEGLMAASQSSTSTRKRRLARQRLKQLKGWARDSPENFDHKVHLIEADLLTSAGHMDKALKLYQASIEGARKEGYTNEQALANERAGYALRDVGRIRAALAHLEQAQILYHQWGAYLKVDHLEQIIKRDTLN